MEVCLHTKAARREILAVSVAEAIAQFYDDKRKCFHMGYVVERAIQAIESGISEQDHSECWIYFRIAVNPRRRKKTIVFDVAESIWESISAVPITRWWWLNKSDVLGPAVRLRLQLPFEHIREAKDEVSLRLTQKGLELSILPYEPELRLFGGVTGIKVAHELFAYDSNFLVAWARQSDIQEQLPLIAPGLSLALMIDLARACGLDLFELWDLFDRIAAKRPLPDNPLYLKCKALASRVIATEPETLFGLYGGERQNLLFAYRTQIRQCAEQLSIAHFRGDLECGLRESLAPIILFHWNRAGLSSGAQAAISRSAADEFERLSRRGTKEE